MITESDAFNLIKRITTHLNSDGRFSDTYRKIIIDMVLLAIEEEQNERW